MTYFINRTESVTCAEESALLQLFVRMTIKWHIGDVVRKLRDAKGWKQQLLAAKAGVSLSTISRLEDGREAKTATVDAVARALGETRSSLYRVLETLEETQRPGASESRATGTAGPTFPKADRRDVNGGPPPGIPERRRR